MNGLKGKYDFVRGLIERGHFELSNFFEIFTKLLDSSRRAESFFK
jgi:hypothetical protein